MSAPAGFFPDMAALDAASVDAPAPAPASDSSSAGQSTTAITTQPPATQVLSSQPSLYVTSADTVVFTVFNSNPSLAGLSLVLRLVLPDGTIQTQQMTINNLTSDRTANQITMDQTEGYLISAMVSGLTVALTRGQTFATASVQRGAAASPLSVFALFSDYVTTASLPQWPNGRNLSGIDGPGLGTNYLSAVPALGGEPILIQPPGVRWRLISVKAQLTTSAAVANRIPAILISSTDIFGGAAVIAQPPVPLAIPASTITQITWGAGCPAFAPDATNQQSSFASDIFLSRQSQIRELCRNFQPTDAFSSLGVQVEEWIDV